MSPQTPPPLSHEEETVIAFSHLLEEADLPPAAEASVPIPPPSTDEVVSRGIDDLSAEIWDWAEQHPGVSDRLSDFIAELDPDTGGSDDDSVAGMDLGDVSLPDENTPGGAPGAGTGPGTPQPGRGRQQRGGRPGMTGNQPGSPHNAAASELEDPEGLYVLRNAVNLARDLARTMRDRRT